SPTEHTPGVLAHIVHKTTPNPESHTLSLHDALPILVLAGIPDDDMTTFQAATARRKGLTIKTSRRMGEVYDRAIRLVENGLVEIASLATHRFGFDEIDQAFTQAQDRVGLKVIIEPWRDASS